MVLISLKDCGFGVLLATLDFLIFIALTVLLDPFEHSLLFVLLAHFEHLAVLGFDSVH